MSDHAPEVRVGQTWRNTDDGYLMRVVALKDGYAYVRHPNAKHGAIQTHLAWFSVWHLVREAH
jgi:hypothetical protein